MKTLAQTLAILLLATPVMAKPKKGKDKKDDAPAAVKQADDAEKAPGAGGKPAADPMAAPPPAAGATPAAGGAAPVGGPLDAPPPAPAPDPTPAPLPPPGDNIVKEAPPSNSSRGAFLIGIKAGGLFAEPFTDGRLGAWGFFDVEVGFNLPFFNKAFAILLDGGYTQPEANGTTTDPRIDANMGTYTWNLVQREVLLGLTVMGRLTTIGNGKIVPYLGVGPRLWLLQTSVKGEAGTGNMITETLEQSTKVGFHVPLGVDYLLGPGRLFLEAQLFWAPIDHRSTGDSSVGAISAELGYRLFINL
jgi:opacity protein-like surface antigen